MLVVGNDKIKSLPDFVAARPPGGMVSVAAGRDAAKAGPRRNAPASAGRKLDFVIVLITPTV